MLKHNSASQPHAYLQVVPVEQFPENHYVVEQSTSYVADRTYYNVADYFSRNTDPEMDLVPTFADGTRTIPCPEVAVVAKNINPSANLLRVSAECYIKRAHPQFVDVATILPPWKTIVWKQTCDPRLVVWM